MNFAAAQLAVGHSLYGLTEAEIKIVEGAGADQAQSEGAKSRKSKPRLEKARSV